MRAVDLSFGLRILPPVRLDVLLKPILRSGSIKALISQISLRRLNSRINYHLLRFNLRLLHHFRNHLLSLPLLLTLRIRPLTQLRIILLLPRSPNLNIILPQLLHQLPPLIVLHGINLRPRSHFQHRNRRPAPHPFLQRPHRIVRHRHQKQQHRPLDVVHVMIRAGRFHHKRLEQPPELVRHPFQI
uniref:(northern house mosquito) hypothetical protein n=1 Tax=Culex pipiens TaxID=7175 RepID=A0A8D8DZM9_CULPI